MFLRFRYLLIISSAVLILSCAGDAYLLNGENRTKLYKSEKGSAVSYLIKKNRNTIISDRDFFLKAHIGNVLSPYNFIIQFEDGSRRIEQPVENLSENILYFRIPAGQSVRGFIIEPLDKTSDFPLIKQIDYIDSEKYLTGIKFEDTVLHISDSFSMGNNGERDSYKTILNTPSDRFSETVIDFDYLSEDHSNETLEIIITDIEKSRIYLDYTPLYGSNNIILNSRFFENSFSSIEISALKGTVSVKNIYSRPDPALLNEGKKYVPIKTGFGPILFSDKLKWRRDEFELFSWNYFPDFLIVDTRDYAYQAAMFKRLAFYVEKPGSRGILRSNEEIENLHGWNAHDYKSSDLASFFNKAAEADFSLNREEKILKNILLENSVIKREGERYLPGNGGILSISRESSGYLRRIFITHEGYHGVFFSSEEFRKECEIIWDDAEPELKEFWKLFFEYKKYDTDDHYLLVNEFMAYNLQQPLDRVIPYYFDHVIPRLMERYPEKSDFLTMLLEEKEEQFISDAEKVAAALYEITSLPAGSLILLNKNSNH